MTRKCSSKNVSQHIHMVAGLMILLAPTDSFAAFTVHTNQSSFNASTGAGLVVEDFEGESGTASPLTANGTALTQVSSDADSIFNYSAGQNGTNSINIQGFADWSTTFSLSQPVRAFGVEVVDYFEIGLQNLSFATSAGESGSLLTAGPLPNGNLEYLGITTNLPFDSFTLIATGTLNDAAFLDNVGYSFTVVPEPSGLILAATALLGVLSRRRKST